MSELIERVARQLIVPLGYDHAVDWERTWVGNNLNTPETGSLKHLCLALAEHALEALREPTEAMVESGVAASPEEYGSLATSFPISGERVRAIWQAMIGAAPQP